MFNKIKSAFRTLAAPTLIYRQIVSREPCEDGEVVHLECGHSLHLVNHKRASWPCPMCAEEKDAKS